MTVIQKRLVSIVLFGLLTLTATYFETDRLEFHRLIVGLIGIFEAIMFAGGLGRFDKFATANKWSTEKTLGRKALLCFGLIIIMVTIDRLINYTLTSYNKDYKIIWTIIIPGTVMVSQLFRLLDFWAVENEKRDQTRGT